MTLQEKKYLTLNLNGSNSIETCKKHLSYLRKRINEPQNKFDLEMALLGYSDWQWELELIQKEKLK